MMNKRIETEEDLKDFYKILIDNHYEGIYIKSDMYPCGWDYVELSDFYDECDMMEEILILRNFSDGNYDWHTYAGWSPYQMLRDLGENWCFEREDIDWN